MKLERPELSISNYECSLCKLDFKSFGKMQEHMLKDHLLNVKYPNFSSRQLSKFKFLGTNAI